MMVFFRCLVTCGQSVVLWAANANAEKEKILFFRVMVLIFFGADSNVKLAENPFININLRCMAAILDPERASERASRGCTLWTRLSAKCTGKKEGTFYIAQSMHVTHNCNTMNTLHDGLMSSLTAQLATSLDSLLPFNCKCTLYWCQRLCKGSEKNVVEFAKRVEQSPALCSKG